MCGCRKSRVLRDQRLRQNAGPMLSTTIPSGMTCRPNAVDLIRDGPNHKPAQSSQSSHIQPPHSSYVSDSRDYPADGHGNHPSVDPPAYDQVVASQIAANETKVVAGIPFSGSRCMAGQLDLPTKFQPTSPQTFALVQTLVMALTAHQSCGKQGRVVRKAQKKLRDELYKEEVAKRKAMYGKLRCGEKCEIWEEVKAINLGW